MNWFKKSQYNQYGIPLDFEEVTHSPFYDNLISDEQMGWIDPKTWKSIRGPKKQYFQDVKGYKAKIEYMSPDDYIGLCAKGFYGDSSEFDIDKAKERLIMDRRYSRTDEDISLIENYKDRWISGENPPMGFIEYGNGKFRGQEGLHRAIMARDLGVKLIPVLIVDY